MSSLCVSSNDYYIDATSYNYTANITGGCNSVTYTYSISDNWVDISGNWVNLPQVWYVPDWAVSHDQHAVDAAITRIATANDRAEKLLLACLSPEQRRQYVAKQFFELTSQGGTRYAIYKRRAGNVYRLDAEGRALAKLCCHPSIACPDADTMLTQKFMLETDDLFFVGRANASRPDLIGLQHRELAARVAARVST